ncbi:hypothetical protein [Reinekea blandensis]|uniref:Uncharacterized protein n=1 Tax=Reinekea blandensis MED297 TaxID=314283 RepID=A4BG34_9GAMM|nr:hypothetical protein [Reinekea blandensis]EAR08829.1 hypothetical protein MED297_04147 [Reinekea sp. MED297] [Reinekea blandensis MED297]
MRFMSLLCAVMPTVMGATITTEMHGVTPHSDLPTLHVWKYSDVSTAGSHALSTNSELGEKGTVHIIPSGPPPMHFDEKSYIAWDLAVNGNTVHNVIIDTNWMRFPGIETLVLDREVAQRTMSLVAGQALNSDIFYRHYVTRFSLNYFDPFVYLGAREKRKYLDFFAGENIYIQSLAKGLSDNYASVSDKVITKEQWVSYSRHKVDGNSLHSTLVDDDIAPHMVFIRGIRNDRYLTPGEDSSLQERTISLDMDIALNKDALINRVQLNEPALFVNLVSLNMTCRDKSAVQVLNWILNDVVSLSDTPDVHGKYVLSAAILYNKTMACLQQHQDAKLGEKR